jgi:hypothetical protein
MKLRPTGPSSLAIFCFISENTVAVLALFNRSDLLFKVKELPEFLPERVRLRKVTGHCFGNSPSFSSG